MTSYTHQMSERYCSLCVSTLLAAYPEVFSREDARIHIEAMREAILAELQDRADDGRIESITRSELAIAIGENEPEMRPTQTCISLASNRLEELGYLVKIENYASPRSRMRAPNSYQLTAQGLSWMGGSLQS